MKHAFTDHTIWSHLILRQLDPTHSVSWPTLISWPKLTIVTLVRLYLPFLSTAHFIAMYRINVFKLKALLVEISVFYSLTFFLFQSSLIDLKEHASSLASAGLKRDSKLKSLEIAIEQKKEECSKLEAQLKKVSEVWEKNHAHLKMNL